MADSNDGVQPPVEVKADTDNLDEFEALFRGKAQQKTQEDIPDVDENDETEDEAELEEAETEAEEVETEASDEGEDEDILKPKKNRKTAKERISELTAKAREAELREAETLARLRDLESRLNQNQQPAQPVQAPAPAAGAPNPTALNPDGSLVYPLGEYDPTFIRDLSRFSIAQETAAYKEQLRAEQEAANIAAAEQKLQADWQVKLTKAEKDFSDLRPVIASLEPELRGVDPNLGTYLAQTIMGMEVGPQVLYYLANNVDEARKIVAAGPVNATLALGRLEARIEGAMQKRATTSRPTKAPEPAPAPRGTGARQSIRGDTDSLVEFEKAFYSKR